MSLPVLLPLLLISETSHPFLLHLLDSRTLLLDHKISLPVLRLYSRTLILDHKILHPALLFSRTLLLDPKISLPVLLLFSRTLLLDHKISLPALLLFSRTLLLDHKILLPVLLPFSRILLLDPELPLLSRHRALPLSQAPLTSHLQDHPHYPPSPPSPSLRLSHLQGLRIISHESQVSQDNLVSPFLRTHQDHSPLLQPQLCSPLSRCHRPLQNSLTLQSSLVPSSHSHHKVTHLIPK